MPGFIDPPYCPATDILFGSAFNHSPIGMALVGLNGRWLTVNSALCGIFGYSESDLLKIDFQTLTHPEDLHINLLHVDQLLQGDISSFESEKRYIHKNGSTIWALLSVSLVRNTNNDPDFFISQIQNISARKQAEECLIAEQERIRVTLNTMCDGVIAADVKGRIASINPMGETITGWTSQEAVGMPVDKVMHLIDEKRHGGIANP